MVKPTVTIITNGRSFYSNKGSLNTKGPRVFWCKNTQNYLLLKKGLIGCFHATGTPKMQSQKVISQFCNFKTSL
jgi:hypothetical protein